MVSVSLHARACLSATLNTTLRQVHRRGTHGKTHLDLPVHVPLRIMPLGGSITHGVGSSHGNGYRATLCDMLISDGYRVEMVGSRKAASGNGSHHYHHHEGWRGYRIDEIAAKAARYVPELRPHVVALNAGSNDCIQDFHIDEAGERIGQMLQCIWSTSPRTTVLLSTLAPNVDAAVEARIGRVNEQIRTLGYSQAGHKNLVLVEVHDGLGLDQLSQDGIHPNDDGYHTMAQLWRQGFHQAASKDLF